MDKFPTSFYERNNILTCPNGDQLRSDDEGTFCWIEGDRVPAVVVNGVVVLQVEEKPKSTKVKAGKVEGATDANG
jgi:hypothetical protein